ncbi:MAG: S1/P1 nuclease [Oligoflexales bacterium]
MTGGLKPFSTASLIVATLACSQNAWAWGETGHNIIGRVAARLVRDSAPEPLSKFVEYKVEMMGHLCNIPDISWRDAPEKISDSNSPTHYIDVEYLLADGKTLDFKAFPKTILDAQKVLDAHCKANENAELCPKGNSFSEKMDRVGTNPWRIQQLLTMATARMKAFSERPKAKSSKDEKRDSEGIQMADDVATFWGISGHFVGDLANPLHTTTDYDGWKRNQGGLHQYFETDLVNYAPLDLTQDVYDYIRIKKPWENIILPILKRNGADQNDFFLNALALIENSFGNIDALYQLDEKISLVGKSLMKNGTKVPAQRKDLKEAYGKYREFIIARLALAADTLGHLWMISWEKAGKPELNLYNSYNYPLNPVYIWPDYLKAN